MGVRILTEKVVVLSDPGNGMFAICPDAVLATIGNASRVGAGMRLVVLVRA